MTTTQTAGTEGQRKERSDTHTPGPWKTAGRFAPTYVVDKDGGTIADCDQIAGLPDRDAPNQIANAAHIVHCVNTHDALVDGLAYLVHVIGEANVPGNIIATLEQARKEQQP